MNQYILHLLIGVNMAVIGRTLRALDLDELGPKDLVVITFEDGRQLVGRLILVPVGSERRSGLQLGKYKGDDITWKLGPDLPGIGTVPRNGKWDNVELVGKVIAGKKLWARIIGQPEALPRQFGKVADFRCM